MNSICPMSLADDLVDTILAYLPKATQYSLIGRDKLGTMAFEWFYHTIYIGRFTTKNGESRRAFDVDHNLWIFRPKKRPEVNEIPLKVDVSYYDRRFEQPIFSTVASFHEFLAEVPAFCPKKIVVRSIATYKELCSLEPAIRSRCEHLVLQLLPNEGFTEEDVQCANVPDIVLREWGTNPIRLPPGVKRAFLQECRDVQLNKDLEELFAVQSSIQSPNLNDVIAPRHIHLNQSVFHHKHKFQPSLKSLAVSPYEEQSLENLTELRYLSLDPVYGMGLLKLPPSLRTLHIQQAMLLRDLKGLDQLAKLTELSLAICMLKVPDELATVKLPPCLRKLVIYGLNCDVFSGKRFRSQPHSSDELYPNLDLCIHELNLPSSLTELQVSDTPIDMGEWKYPHGLVSLTIGTIFTLGSTRNQFESLKYLRLHNIAKVDSSAFPPTLKELEICASEPDSTQDGSLDLRHLPHLKRLVLKDNQFAELLLPDAIDELIVKEQSLGEFRCPSKAQYLHLTTSAAAIRLSATLKELELEALTWKNLQELENLSNLTGLKALITADDLDRQVKVLAQALNKLRYVSLNGVDYTQRFDKYL